MREKFYTAEDLEAFLEMRAEQIMDLCPINDDGSKGICAIMVGQEQRQSKLDIYFATSNCIEKFDEALSNLSPYCLLKRSLARIPIEKRLFSEIEDQLFPAMPISTSPQTNKMTLGK